uniref:Transcription factor GTE4 isoform X2 n=1 Tax=Rhizophora mucronata TaxID=61149 RepID=A0A2P2PAL2_RHIMU
MAPSITKINRGVGRSGGPHTTHLRINSCKFSNSITTTNPRTIFTIVIKPITRLTFFSFNLLFQAPNLFKFTHKLPL